MACLDAGFDWPTLCTHTITRLHDRSAKICVTIQLFMADLRDTQFDLLILGKSDIIDLSSCVLIFIFIISGFQMASGSINQSIQFP